MNYRDPRDRLEAAAGLLFVAVVLIAAMIVALLRSL